LGNNIENSRELTVGNEECEYHFIAIIIHINISFYCTNILEIGRTQ
jgi:hypothetical protein